MTDYESKTNKELNEIAALRCGWISVYREYARRVVWFSSDWKEKHHDVGAVAPPDYTDPLNLGLCFRDYVPVLREKKFDLNIVLAEWFDERYEVGIGSQNDPDPVCVYDTNPARAFTIAFLAATDGY